MIIEVLADGDSVARHAAAIIAAEARVAVAARGRFLLAVSGGRTPWVMLRALADEDVPWPSVHVFQVDERVAPAGHPDRNLTHLAASLPAHAPLPPAQLHAMPVEWPDLEEAAARYARTLEEHAGRPVVLDVVHLGLGPDGHTASLVPGDAALDVSDADVRAEIDSARWPGPDCMQSRKAFVRKIALLLLLMPGPLLADEVFLKGGGKFTGRITEQDEERITVDIGDGSVGFSMERVDHIVKGLSPLDEYNAQASKLGAQDVDGWRRLAQWASSKGLSRQSRLAWENVLAVAPDDAAARQALGFVQLDGRWLTEEESFRARGFVKYEGEWMTPAEVQVAQSTATAEQARQDAERRAMDAEAAAADAQRRAEDAEKRAQEAQNQQYSDPVFFGGFGYGVTTWPSAGGPVTRPPVNRPPVNRPTPRPIGGW